MGDLNELVVHIGQQKSGRWIAATARSPYFCFEAESQEAVREVASAALAFYGRALKERATMTAVSFTTTVTAKELVAA